MDAVPWLLRRHWKLAAAAAVPLALAAIVLPARVAPHRRIAANVALAPAEPPTAADLAPPAAAAPRRAPSPAIEAQPLAALHDSEAPLSRPTTRLELIVADAVSGAAAPGAQVELALERGEHLQRTADSRGVVSIDLEPGTLSAVAWSDARTGGPLELELAAGALQRAEIALHAGVSVLGRVIDARSGAPIEGAAVSFWTHAELDVAVTDAGGRFRHPRFPAQQPSQQVRVEAAGYAPAVRYLELDQSGDLVHRAAHAGERDVHCDLANTDAPCFEIALAPALVLEGRVLDRAGRPLAGARVVARGYARILQDVATRDEGEALTDAAGLFAIRGLRGDVSHALLVRASGCAELVREVPAEAWTERAELGDLHLARAALVAGAVVDATGEPAAGVRVLLRRLDLAAPAPATLADPGARPDVGRREVRADAAGAFLLEELAAGRYELCVRRDRGVLASLELELSPAEERSDVRLELAPGTWTLAGVVRGPDGPLAGAAVALARFGAVAELATDAAGAFRVAGLDDVATYTLRASAEGCAPVETLVAAFDQPVLSLSAAPEQPPAR